MISASYAHEIQAVYFDPAKEVGELKVPSLLIKYIPDDDSSTVKEALYECSSVMNCTPFPFKGHAYVHGDQAFNFVNFTDTSDEKGPSYKISILRNDTQGFEYFTFGQVSVAGEPRSTWSWVDGEYQYND